MGAHGSGDAYTWAHSQTHTQGCTQDVTHAFTVTWIYTCPYMRKYKAHTIVKLRRDIYAHGISTGHMLTQ